MHELLKIQEQFQQYLLQESALPNIFIATQKVSAETRANIYHEAYQLRLLEVLAEAYPALQKYLGEKTFSKLGLAYLDLTPSTFRSIRWFGDKFPEFLATQKKYQKSPYIVELAEWEWLFSEVFDAADQEIMTLDAIAAIPPTNWPDLQFIFHPSIRRFNSYWNIAVIWEALRNDTEIPRPESSDQPTPWILWRKNLDTSFCALTKIEALALDAAMAGNSWEKICESIVDTMDAEQIPAFIAGLLKGWIIEGLISGTSFNIAKN